jgi:hypothetical protein
MTRTNLSIAILSATAAFMLAAHVFLPTNVNAANVIKDRDYQVVTARVQAGGEGLYILDNRTGQVAVFTYDPATRGLRPRQVRPVSDAFAVPR